MKTKLVYVLTCAPEATYIEQALISIWSARYHNPDAHIVLLVDDKTNELLVGKRAEVLEYVTEKVVVHFEDDNVTMMYRSRWIKTQVRQLVKGDLLFIDCDTIVTQSLSEIDEYDYDVAMVLDEHLQVNEYNDDLKRYLQSNSLKLGYDVLKEKEYFNSGVIYSKDSNKANNLWILWHKYWCNGQGNGVSIDQPALGLANLQSNHVIQQLPHTWNTLVYMNPIFISKGKILHFWNFRNKSFIFCSVFLKYVRKFGLNIYVKECILNPLRSILPFDNILSVTSMLGFFKHALVIRSEREKYAKYVDERFVDFPWNPHYSLLKKYIKIRILRKNKYSDVYYS